MEIILYYFVIINFLTFIVFGLDKYKARKDRYRISENTLLKICLAGGFLGGIFGMIFFRHKTIKSSFQIRFWFVIFIWIGLSLFFLYKYSIDI